ncbi:hypothetical protein [Streptomyces panaciradicis]|uniref:hypothetical protein n=1 Tax=Streptomyces panaciradicis TaxID=1470261 RepID=UPI00201D02F3|nr:hypothetical protein [Streptomyces panaciradicis]MCL6673553.1 hypothetical protein [Streptomyces panaciradicis]
MKRPAVASDAARFRLQAVADHRNDDIDTAIDILDTCIRAARQTIASPRWPRPHTGDRAESCQKGPLGRS